MYKIRLVLLMTSLFIIAASSVHGQIVKSYGLKFGQARASQHWVYFDVSDFNKKPRNGLSAGAFIELNALPMMAVSIEGHYIQKGFKEKYIQQGVSYSHAPRVDYLSIPVLAKFIFTDGLESYFLCGPRVDFKLPFESSDHLAIIDAFQLVGTGASVGFGVTLPKLMGVNLSFEYRYSPNFSKAYDNGAVTVENDSMELLLGVGF